MWPLTVHNWGQVSEDSIPISSLETAFERPRGVSSVEVRDGYSQVHVSHLEHIDLDRLKVLRAVADAEVSLDFVKMTPSGFSFIVRDTDSEAVSVALKGISGMTEGHGLDAPHFSVREKRSIVIVHAVNIRDEEGLISRVVQAAITVNAHIDHIGDMHDRVLLVVHAEDARRLAQEMQAMQTDGTAIPAPRGFISNPEGAPANCLKIKVMKFGGTSVATAKARMQSALKVVSAKEKGFMPIVVVSAIGRRGEPYATDTLIGLLKEIDPNVTPDPRESDLMLACGEILSSVIFAHTLKTLGHSAMAFRGGQAGIRTDGVYGNARIVGLNPVALFRAVEDGQIPVVCGFQGVYVPPNNAMPGGELTTLGRGGSDTTASAVGAAVKAEAVEIFTDVEGVKTADPDFVPHAPTLRKVTYDEVAEIAHLGAKVVHPRAAEIAMKFDIPLWVKSTFSDDEGTEIVQRDAFPGRRVTGVTHTGKLVYLQFRMGDASEEDRTRLQTHIYQSLARFNVNLFMVNLSPSGTGFAVPRDQYPIVRDVFDGLVIPLAGGSVYLVQIGAASPEVETQAKLLESVGSVCRIPVDLTEGCTMVSIVGHEYMQQPGVFYRVLSTLKDASVPVLQTTDSDYSLSCLIPESELERAVRLMHAAFVDKLG